MLNNLYRLYKNNKHKSPLEDFTTESFVGILKFDESLLTDFCVSFLRLEKEVFSINTQVKFSLIDNANCIVDIVIESSNQLCFIENKVNSREGFRQLERYSKVLDTYNLEGKTTYLFYCTKNFEEKTLTKHKFNQFRWFEVAKFLQRHPSESKIKEDFLKFIKQKKMSQDLTLTTKNTFVIENLFETIELINGHLNRAKPLFIETFDKEGARINDGFSTTQIINYKRLIYYFKDVIGESDRWSEIKYGFQLNNLKIYCGIWIDKKNTEHDNFKTYILNNQNGFQIINSKNGNGFGIELSESLGKYINENDCDEKILSWYRDSFNIIKDVIEKTKNLNWKINIDKK
mgnify:CR=1 FL=1